MLLWVQVGSFFPIFTYCNLSDPGGTIGFQAIVNLLWKNLRLRRLYDVLITVQGLVRSIVDFNIENLGDLKQIICELFFSSSVKYLFQQQLCECEWLGYSKRTINTFKKKVPWQAFSSIRNDSPRPLRSAWVHSNNSSDVTPSDGLQYPLMMGAVFHRTNNILRAYPIPDQPFLILL